MARHAGPETLRSTVGGGEASKALGIRALASAANVATYASGISSSLPAAVLANTARRPPRVPGQGLTQPVAALWGQQSFSSSPVFPSGSVLDQNCAPPEKESPGSTVLPSRASAKSPPRSPQLSTSSYRHCTPLPSGAHFSVAPPTRSRAMSPLQSPQPSAPSSGHCTPVVAYPSASRFNGAITPQPATSSLPMSTGQGHFATASFPGTFVGRVKERNLGSLSPTVPRILLQPTSSPVFVSNSATSLPTPCSGNAMVRGPSPTPGGGLSKPTGSLSPPVPPAWQLSPRGELVASSPMAQRPCLAQPACDTGDALFRTGSLPQHIGQVSLVSPRSSAQATPRCLCCGSPIHDDGGLVDTGGA